MLSALPWSVLIEYFGLADASFKISSASLSVFCRNSSKLPQRVLSAGISVLSYQAPLTNLKKSFLASALASIKEIFIPGFFFKDSVWAKTDQVPNIIIKAIIGFFFTFDLINLFYLHKHNNISRKNHSANKNRKFPGGNNLLLILPKINEWIFLR